MGATGVDALLTDAGSGVASRTRTTSSIGGNTLDGRGKVANCVVDGKDAGAEAKERRDWTCGSGVATSPANAGILRYLPTAEAKIR